MRSVRLRSWGALSRSWVAAVGLLLTACVGHGEVAEKFANDFQCRTHIDVVEPDGGGFLARGCGTEARYRCYKTCKLEESHPVGAKEGEDARLAAEQREPAFTHDIRVVTSAGQATLMLDLQLTRTSFLRLSAVPDKRTDLMQLKLMRRDAAARSDRCGLDWMVNNQRVPMPKPIAATDGLVYSQRVQIGPALMDELERAETITLRSCDERYALLKFQVLLVHEFIARLAQENAWKNDQGASATGGLRAPKGGWPAWSPASAQLVTLGGANLDARQLFKKLSASVFQLEVTLSHGAAQGSAVAISTHELLTNCHVLQGAQRIVVRQGASHWAAIILRADPKTDRCIVSAPEASLTPIAASRPYDSLEIGERVFTLGAPVGLELTISDGILSGRREDAGQKFVQSTAPISPGSSGGGLFDAQGNLIGITTLVLAGRERLNQALNFAIPADAFWQK